MPFADDLGTVQLLAFTDYANVHTNTAEFNDVNPNVDLLSVGTGLRYKFRSNMILNVDYGWQLKDSDKSLFTREGSNSRGHVYLNVSY